MIVGHDDHERRMQAQADEGDLSTSVHPTESTEAFPSSSFTRLHSSIAPWSALDANASARYTRYTNTSAYTVEHAAQEIKHTGRRRRDDAINNMSMEPE